MVCGFKSPRHRDPEADERETRELPGQGREQRKGNQGEPEPISHAQAGHSIRTLCPHTEHL